MNKTIADTLPDNWINTTLGNIAQLIMGQSPPGSTYNTKQKGMPFFQGKAEFGALYPVAEKWCTEPLKIAESGDVLMSVRAPVGSVNFADQKCCIGRGLCAIRLEKSLADNFYLFYYLKLIEPFLSQQGQGSTFTAINRDQLIKIKIPLPPLAEQKLIVAILQEADALRRKKKEILEKSNRLASALFLEMFGDPVRNEKGWPKVFLGNVTDLITDGKHGDCTNQENSGYYFISAKDIHDGIIDYSNARQILQKDFEEVHRRTNLKPGDLVIVNTGATIGKMAIATEDFRTQKTTFQKSVAVVKVKLDYLNIFYLKFLFGLSLKDLVKSSSGSAQQNLLLSQMRKIPLILPPLHLQNDFAQKVQAIEDTTKQIESSLQKMEKLYDSLLQKAFTGNLWFDKLTMTKVS